MKSRPFLDEPQSERRAGRAFTWIRQQIGLVDPPTARRVMADWVDPSDGDLLGRQWR